MNYFVICMKQPQQCDNVQNKTQAYRDLSHSFHPLFPGLSFPSCPTFAKKL